MKYQAQMATIDAGTEKQVVHKLGRLEKTLVIKDDVVNNLLYYDGKVDGKRYKTKARYNKCSKEKAMSKITKKQQQLIEELTINFIYNLRSGPIWAVLIHSL